MASFGGGQCYLAVRIKETQPNVLLIGYSGHEYPASKEFFDETIIKGPHQIDVLKEILVRSGFKVQLKEQKSAD